MPRRESRYVTVYIVEDDYAVLDALSLSLSELGYDVACFGSAEQLLESGAPVPGDDDVLIFDLGLPGMTGAELLKRLRERGQAPRAVAISGKSLTLIKQLLSEFPDMNILRKPLSLQVLTAELAC